MMNVGTIVWIYHFRSPLLMLDPVMNLVPHSTFRLVLGRGVQLPKVSQSTELCLLVLDRHVAARGALVLATNVVLCEGQQRFT